MKTSIRLVVNVLSLCYALWAMPGTAHAQIFVSTYGDSKIGEYNLDGTPINASLISGLSHPEGIALSGGDLYVANYFGNAIVQYDLNSTPINGVWAAGVYDPWGVAVSGGYVFSVSYSTVSEYTTSGATVSASLIPGLSYLDGIAVAGDDIFVSYPGNGGPGSGYVGEYTTSGATVNATLISGLFSPSGIAVSGGNIFVADENAGAVYEYTTSGAFVRVIASGLHAPDGIAVSGDDVFVANFTGGTIGEYTTSGETVNASLISGLYEPTGVSIAAVPEPTTLALAGLGGLSLMLFHRRRK